MEIWELKNVMTKIFQNLGRYKPTDSIAEQTTNRINQKKSMPRYIISNFWKLKTEKNLESTKWEGGKNYLNESTFLIRNHGGQNKVAHFSTAKTLEYIKNTQNWRVKENK